MTLRLVRLMGGAVLAAAVAAAWAADAPADGVVRFDITRFSVSGNTLLPQTAVDAAVAPFLGKGRDFGDVQRALEALEGQYHKIGYNLVQVELPEQELASGVVQLKVVQVKIGRVKVKGNQYFDEANIRRSLPELVAGQAPNLTRVSAELKLANENPSKKVAMKLQSAEADDEIDALLEVTDERTWKIAANFDNTGTSSTGKTHAGLVLTGANLFGHDDVASVQYTTTVEKPSQVSVWGAGYHVPLYALGDSLDFFGSYSNVDSGTVAAGLVNLSISGKGATYGARYNRTLAKSDGFEHKLIIGLDYKAFKNSVLYGETNLGNDITVHPLSANYVATWTLAEGDANLSLTYLRNVPGGAKGGEADFALTRVGAPAGYQVLRFSSAYTRSFKNDWQLRVLMNGQYSPDSLIPGEQFGAGGAASVRGFEEREVSNDSGVAANFEAYSPNWCASAHPTWQCRAVLFYDGAYARRSDALPGELTNTTIGSAGLGLRYAVAANLNLQMDWGHVVHAGSTAGTSKNKLHIRVGLSY